MGADKSLTEVGRHLKANPTHIVDHENPKILAFCRKRTQRKFLESLYIQKLGGENQLNEAFSSIKLQLFNT